MNTHIKVKQWHSRNCCLEGTREENYFPTGELYFGNYAGNKNKHGIGHYWIEMQCNDPECTFRAVIEAGVLNDLIKNL